MLNKSFSLKDPASSSTSTFKIEKCSVFIKCSRWRIWNNVRCVVSNNFISQVDRNGSQLWVSGYIWGALDSTTHSIPGSIPGRQLECRRWLQQLTSLQIFTIYTALEKHVYLELLYTYFTFTTEFIFYLTSPSHEQQQVKSDCWMWFFRLPYIQYSLFRLKDILCFQNCQANNPSSEPTLPEFTKTKV